MLFNSLDFLLFFPVVCILYYAIPSLKWRNMFLLVASYYFYMNWEPVYALLLLASTVITYLASLGIDKYENRKKTILAISIVANLSILFFFKYFNWAADNITTLMSVAGVSIHIPEFKVLLPVGISFYTFQALGYSIDVYYKSVKVEKDFFTYALFVSFFPQLVAGPIERSTNLLQQFHLKHKFNGEMAIKGVTLMLWGYFLKLVIADNLAPLVNSVYNHLDTQVSGGSALMASIFFCFQLYGDFAGYSFIAIGSAAVMGYKLMDNFRRPYFFSVSVQDFWKRNHISLTTWFMDYVYYPLVGSSTSQKWWCFCIFFTFFLSGFWHGANWTYVISFSIFGIYLVVCILKEKRQKKFEKKYKLKKKEWWLWLNRIVTFFLVMLALVFFRANTVSDGFTVIQRIFTDLNGALVFLNNKRILFFLFMLFVIEYAIEYKKTSLAERHFLSFYTISSIALAYIIMLFGNFGRNEFIYFQF
ncbi:MAG: MBOAT family protein [Prevotella sp.]|nr:MBOAT family protein [Prevotella sp.]